MAWVFGLLNLDKPSGPTSHDLVAAVRRGARVKKVGHAGTLDPMATGVLVLCLGPATRLSEYVMRSRKVYRARVHFGVVTDTYDAQGKVTARNEALPSREAVEAALAGFRGEILQVPPMYSALKRGGRKLYELARAGQQVERPPRAVTVYRLELLDWQPPFAALEVECSPGTYVRSLAHDLGQTLGCGAHLAALQRCASGRFRVEEAVPWDAFRAAMDAGDWQRYLLPPDLALADVPAVHLSAEQAARVLHGNAIPVVADVAGELVRAYDADGRFIAVLERRGVHWKPQKVFAN